MKTYTYSNFNRWPGRRMSERTAKKAKLVDSVTKAAAIGEGVSIKPFLTKKLSSACPMDVIRAKTIAIGFKDSKGRVLLQS